MKVIDQVYGIAYEIPTDCPKCGAELTDLWDGEPVSAFIGEWSEDRFRCEGKFIPTRDNTGGEWIWVNCEKSCGYFGLNDFGVEEPDNEF